MLRQQIPELISEGTRTIKFVDFGRWNWISASPYFPPNIRQCRTIDLTYYNTLQDTNKTCSIPFLSWLQSTQLHYTRNQLNIITKGLCSFLSLHSPRPRNYLRNEIVSLQNYPFMYKTMRLYFSRPLEDLSAVVITLNIF